MLKKDLANLFRVSLFVNYVTFLALGMFTVSGLAEHSINAAQAAEDYRIAAPRPVVESATDEAPPVVMDVESQIRAIAAEHGFEWPDYLVRLAKCESGLRPDAENREGNNPPGSVDRGLFQINDHWHPEVSDEVAYDPRLSTEWTMWRIESGFQHEWVCDSIIR